MVIYFYSNIESGWCANTKTTSSLFTITSYFKYGGVAQLGERLTGSQEVMGSIPTVSTKKSTCENKSIFLSIAKAMAYHQQRQIAIILKRISIMASINITTSQL